MSKKEVICTCATCGKEFKAKQPRKMYCSPACRSRDLRGNREQIRTCPICGKTFVTWRSKKITCSDECSRKYLNSHDRPTRGKRGKRDEHARWVKQQYGSEEAYQIYLKEAAEKRAAQKEETRLRKERERQERLEKNFRVGTCVVCGKPFETYNPMQKTCCSACGKKLSYARKQHRIPKNQMIDKDITLEALYRRDSGVCYLCGGKCDWSDRDAEKNIVGMMYPSIDHIIPVSRGGLHAWNNVRLAHFGCNADKSDTILPEAKKLIPKNAYKFKREVAPRKKRTLQYTRENVLVREYESAAEAERVTGFKQRGIQKCAQEGTKTYRGYIWRYA